MCESGKVCTLLLQYLKSSAKIVVTLGVGETEKLRAGEVEGGRKKGREG